MNDKEEKDKLLTQRIAEIVHIAKKDGAAADALILSLLDMNKIYDAILEWWALNPCIIVPKFVTLVKEIRENE